MFIHSYVDSHLCNVGMRLYSVSCLLDTALYRTNTQLVKALKDKKTVLAAKTSQSFKRLLTYCKNSYQKSLLQ